MGRSTSLGRLARRAPELARLRLMRAIADAHGNVMAAARLLDVSQDTALRYVRRLDLVTHLREVRQIHGWTSGIYRDRRNDSFGCLSTRVDA